MRWGSWVVLVALVAAGCAGAGGSGGHAAIGGWIDGHPTNGPEAGSGADRKLASSDGAITTTMAPSAGSDVATGEAVPAPGQPTPPQAPPISGALRAGSVDDNERWADYLAYRRQALASGLDVHDVDVTGRVVVSVVDASGHPVLGATVQLESGDGATPVATATTHADGRAYLFPAPGSPQGQQQHSALQVQAALGDAHATAAVADGAVTTVRLTGIPAAAPKQLDVLFCVDTTGSMGDEIDQLKANMVSISDRIAALPVKPDVHFALTVFRDRGDSYVTRTFDFTGDVAAFTKALGEISAQGGGDTPESVNAAIADAIHKPAWRGPDAVKLMFLVGDAAPHLDYTDDVDYTTSVTEAARAGIVIDPIASSGLDDQGEYIFRQLAELTGGRFTFLTYGAAGAPEPGDTTTHHVRDYSVLSLDDLVVRLVSDTMTNSTAEPPTAPPTTVPPTTTTRSQNDPIPPPTAVPGVPSPTAIPGCPVTPSPAAPATATAPGSPPATTIPDACVVHPGILK